MAENQNAVPLPMDTNEEELSWVNSLHGSLQESTGQMVTATGDCSQGSTLDKDLSYGPMPVKVHLQAPQQAKAPYGLA